jgi:integrase
LFIIRGLWKELPEKPDLLADPSLSQLYTTYCGFFYLTYYPHLLCSLRTGMRIGEIKALKWHDIDFEKRQIETNHNS